MTGRPEQASRRATLTRRLSTALLLISLLLYPLAVIAANRYAPGLALINTDPVSDVARVISYVLLPATILVKAATAAKEATSLVLVLIAVLSIPLLGEYFSIINELLR